MVMLAIFAPYPREEAAMRASRPPLEWAIRFTFSAPVSARMASIRAVMAPALVSTLAQQSWRP